MKKPEYKIGDYVEFKYAGELKKGFVSDISLMNNIYGRVYTLKNRSGFTHFISADYFDKDFEIIRKLPINRDKNGRFSKKIGVHLPWYHKSFFTEAGILDEKKDGKVKVMFKCDATHPPKLITVGEPFIYKKEKKDCSCFNCNKCVEQMRAYYEKTGELAKKQKEEFGQKPYDDFGSRLKVEEKKPSERILEILSNTSFTKDGYTISNRDFVALCQYLDEQWEKGKKC